MMWNVVIGGVGSMWGRDVLSASGKLSPAPLKKWS